MEVIRKGEVNKRKFKYGDIVEYSNTDVCMVVHAPTSYLNTLLIVLKTGTLLRSYEGLDQLNLTDELTLICENEDVVITLPTKSQINLKLTKEDKDYLEALGHNERDFNQIEEATSKTEYTLENDKKISRKKVIELLGRKEYISGISRSAFHWTTVRYNEDETIAVYFDSSELFR